MPIPFLAIAAGVSALSGVISGAKSTKKAKQAAQQARRDQSAVKAQIENYQRQELTNPFGNVTNTAAGITNTLQGQQVGLQGAQFGREQYSQNLANILDAQTQAGGQSAATATALARQAGQFAQQQGASIQQQEIANQRAAATQDFQRQQLVSQGEQRAQHLRGVGEQYLTGLREQRDVSNLAGLGQQLTNAQVAETSAQQAAAAGRASVTKGLFGIAGAAVQAGAFAPGPRATQTTASAITPTTTPQVLQTQGPVAPVFTGSF